MSAAREQCDRAALANEQLLTRLQARGREGRARDCLAEAVGLLRLLDDVPRGQASPALNSLLDRIPTVLSRIDRRH